VSWRLRSRLLGLRRKVLAVRARPIRWARNSSSTGTGPGREWRIRVYRALRLARWRAVMPETIDLELTVGPLLDALGTVTSHLVNWLSPMKERVTVVTGERGTFVADTLHADLTFHANGVVPTEWDDIARFRGVTEGDMIRYAIAKPEPLRVEHEAFRDAVLGKDSDIVTMRQGMATVAVAEAVLESALKGQTVTVDGIAHD
jgi:predicted dehydrogenase